MNRIKLGILGTGRLGKIHLKQAMLLHDLFDVVGFYDPDREAAEQAVAMGAAQFHDEESLISHCDAVLVVTTTASHYQCATAALRMGKHLFIEKPMASTLDEARKLLDLSREAAVCAQVGHIERFNPAFTAARHHLDQVMFIEAHRLAEFDPRGTDVSVVHDLMIHDIDIVLTAVKANLKRVMASGIAVLSDEPDICNARLEFDNGAVANLTASRISLTALRKARFFQRNAYITVDFLQHTCHTARLLGENEASAKAINLKPAPGKAPKKLLLESSEVHESNAIADELSLFAASITQKTKPIVSMEEGFAALSIAHAIVEQLEQQKSIFAR